ncbi:MAG TPA: hypothetical protein PLK54_01925 [Ferruginibacter sp.]|nr:hypothetical protein [Chitinophagales bacterium]HMW26519.1 hypothetical protein [Ferruginibacter sp.]HMX35926.1 hypothetical protein [Ferruginibacter sp.]HMZ99644.1 hypothetical protein [Ferruginibacter sp.]HNA16329.1 hypothetical protein [Ferruginibacter sp.]
MNRIATLLIIVVLALRGFIFYNDHYGSKTMVAPKPDEAILEPRAVEQEATIPATASTVTFILAEQNDIYYYKGKFEGRLQKTSYTQVRSLILGYKKTIGTKDLMFLIKSAPGSTFKNAIDILDEMSVTEIPPGHYAEVELTQEETDKLHIIKTTKNG